MDGTIIIRIPVRHHPGTICGIVDRRNVAAPPKYIKSVQFHRKRHLCQSPAVCECVLIYLRHRIGDDQGCQVSTIAEAASRYMREPGRDVQLRYSAAGKT